MKLTPYANPRQEGEHRARDTQSAVAIPTSAGRPALALPDGTPTAYRAVEVDARPKARGRTTSARAAFLGISATGELIACPFHDGCEGKLMRGHRHARWVCGTWAKPAGLVEIHATRRYGSDEVRSLLPAESCRWKSHLDNEAGCLAPEVMALKGEIVGTHSRDTCYAGGCSDVSSTSLLAPSVSRVRFRPEVLAQLGWVAFYLASRELGGGKARCEPFAYSQRFAAAWSGIRSHRGIDALKAAGVLVPVGEIANYGRRATPLYILGGDA